MTNDPVDDLAEAYRDLYDFCESSVSGQNKPTFEITGYTHDECYSVKIVDKKGGGEILSHVSEQGRTLAHAIRSALEGFWSERMKDHHADQG